jgi:hypothetical protein
MFTNKHVIIAMIVAPVLAILAWIAVGQLAGERSHSARPGQSYPLVEKSNCRYESGTCDLENEDFKLRLTFEQAAGDGEFILSASHPLRGVLLGIGAEGEAGQPATMRASDGQGLEWRLAVGGRPGPGQRVHLVARAGDSSYFGEAATTFLQPGQD